MTAASRRRPSRSFGTAGSQRHDRRRCLAATGVQVLGQVARLLDGQRGQRTGGEGDGTVRMAATAAPVDHRQPSLQPGQRGAVAGAEIASCPRRSPVDRTCTVRTAGRRRAPGTPGSARSRPRMQPPGGSSTIEPTPLVNAGCGECGCAVGHVGELLQVDPAAGNTAEQRPTGRQRAGTGEYLAQRGTVRHLDNAGPRDGAADRHQAGTWFGGGADPGEPAPARTGRAARGARAFRRCRPESDGRRRRIPRSGPACRPAGRHRCSGIGRETLPRRRCSGPGCRPRRGQRCRPDVPQRPTAGSAPRRTPGGRRARPGRHRPRQRPRAPRR